MSGKENSQPSAVALGHLIKRIEDDATLDADIRAAVLADLTSQSPAAFTSLKKILSGTGQDDEADEPQSQ